MDQLIYSLDKFKISNDQDQLENDLDKVINMFNEHDVHDVHDEWETLSSNYSKLRYLHDIVTNYYIPESDKFLIALKQFMKQIDKMNTRYIDEINWYEETDNQEILKIKHGLDLSLFQDDEIAKMNYALDSYKILVPIIEKLRKEKYKDKINDTKFLVEFDYKRRKI